MKLVLPVTLPLLCGSSGTRRLRTCLARWRAFLICRRQSALAKRLAEEHRRGAVLWRCLSAWLVLAQQAAARQLQVKGMREYQRMMQVRVARELVGKKAEQVMMETVTAL